MKYKPELSQMISGRCFMKYHISEISQKKVQAGKLLLSCWEKDTISLDLATCMRREVR